MATAPSPRAPRPARPAARAHLRPPRVLSFQRFGGKEGGRGGREKGAGGREGRRDPSPRRGRRARRRGGRSARPGVVFPAVATGGLRGGAGPGGALARCADRFGSTGGDWHWAPQMPSEGPLPLPRPLLGTRGGCPENVQAPAEQRPPPAGGGGRLRSPGAPVTTAERAEAPEPLKAASSAENVGRPGTPEAPGPQTPPRPVRPVGPVPSRPRSVSGESPHFPSRMPTSPAVRGLRTPRGGPSAAGVLAQRWVARAGEAPGPGVRPAAPRRGQ